MGCRAFGVVLALGCTAGDRDEVTPIDLANDCVEGLTLCDGRAFLWCTDGRLQTVEMCAPTETCDPGVGCTACPPAGQVCVDDVLHACTVEGVGEPIERCAGGCEASRCVDDCAAGTDLVYVVDTESDLLSFDPRTDTFRGIGRLRCPAGDAWPRWGQREARPFSMSVDRGGRAWVLFTSGEVFWVDTTDARCTPSGFEPGQGGFELFGMGFVSDAPGSRRETLYVAGGAVGELRRGTLGAIDPGTLALSPVGPLPATDFGAELTGNANGELFGYFPGGDTRVVRLDKSDGSAARSWSLPAFAGEPSAWAFAHWGGRYYIFITTRAGETENERVLRFNPADGEVEVVLERTGHRIVGAGVSTCAPTVANF